MKTFRSITMAALAATTLAGAAVSSVDTAQAQYYAPYGYRYRPYYRPYAYVRPYRYGFYGPYGYGYPYRRRFFY